MKTFSTLARLLPGVLFATLLSGPISAVAAAASDKAPTAKTKKAKKASGGKITLLPHSGENAAQRSQRLKRECKGRVNAGACEGYTS